MCLLVLANNFVDPRPHALMILITLILELTPPDCVLTLFYFCHDAVQLVELLPTRGQGFCCCLDWCVVYRE